MKLGSAAALALWLTTVAASGCSTVADDGRAAAPVATQDQLRARTSEYSRAIVEASAAGWPQAAVARIADFYADDTIVFPPRGEPIRGRAAITAYWTRPAERRILTHSANAQRIDVSGDLATEWGQLSITSQQGSAAPVRSRATYISVWTRRGGVWRKQMDTWW